MQELKEESSEKAGKEKHPWTNNTIARGLAKENLQC